MSRETPAREPPRWARLLGLGLIAMIVVGLTYRTLEDAASVQDAVRGLVGIGLFCLWLGYSYVSRTRWRDRNARAGLALLGCLAITGAVLSLLTAADGQWLDRELAITVGAAVLFSLALVLSRYVSLSSRAFGVLVSAAGIGIVGIGLTAHGTERSLDAISTGGICLVIGCLYVWKPNAMERLENGTD
ncbi:hypothetical protein HTG_09225 [Natrinema mahii]|nr:hypothetical protein HTG_09225 [Natrinema mahii]